MQIDRSISNFISKFWSRHQRNIQSTSTPILFVSQCHIVCKHCYPSVVIATVLELFQPKSFLFFSTILCHFSLGLYPLICCLLFFFPCTFVLPQVNMQRSSNSHCYLCQMDLSGRGCLEMVCGNVFTSQPCHVGNSTKLQRLH